MKKLTLTIGLLMISRFCWATDALPTGESLEMPEGASIAQTMEAADQAQNLVDARQALADWRENSSALEGYEVLYNSEGYVEQVLFNDGKTLSFKYLLGDSETVSRVDIFLDGHNFLRVESDDYGERGSQGLELPRETLDLIVNQATPFRLIKKTDSETFQKFVSCFKKSTVEDKTYYSAIGPQESVRPEEIFKSLKNLFGDLRHQEEKAAEIYSRNADSKGTREEPPVLRENDDTEAVPIETMGTNEAALIRSGDAPREAFLSSIERGLVRFSSRLEAIIPGHTLIEVSGEVTEILLVPPQPNPA